MGRNMIIQMERWCDKRRAEKQSGKSMQMLEPEPDPEPEPHIDKNIYNDNNNNKQ